MNTLGHRRKYRRSPTRRLSWMVRTCGRWCLESRSCLTASVTKSPFGTADEGFIWKGENSNNNLSHRDRSFTLCRSPSFDGGVERDGLWVYGGGLKEKKASILVRSSHSSLPPPRPYGRKEEKFWTPYATTLSVRGVKLDQGEKVQT